MELMVGGSTMEADIHCSNWNPFDKSLEFSIPNALNTIGSRCQKIWIHIRFRWLAIDTFRRVHYSPDPWNMAPRKCTASLTGCLCRCPTARMGRLDLKDDQNVLRGKSHQMALKITIKWRCGNIEDDGFLDQVDDDDAVLRAVGQTEWRIEVR